MNEEEIINQVNYAIRRVIKYAICDIQSEDNTSSDRPKISNYLHGTPFAECTDYMQFRSYADSLCNHPHDFLDMVDAALEELTEEKRLLFKQYKSKVSREIIQKGNVRAYLYADTDVKKAEILAESTYGNLNYMPETRKWIYWTGYEWDFAKASGVNTYHVHEKIQTVSFKIDLELENLERKLACLEQTEDKEGIKKLEQQVEDMRKLSKEWGNMHKRRAIIEALMHTPGISHSLESFDAYPNYILTHDNKVISMSKDRDITIIVSDPLPGGDNLVRNLRLTKKLGASFDENAEAKLWEKYLTRVLPCPKVRRYIQQAVGYSMFGEVNEKAIFFLYGVGDNGKSVFTHIISELFGEYGKNSNKSLFVGKNKFSNIDGNVLAEIKGKRFVINDTEIAPDDRLNEDLIKTITGNDGMITARRVYEKETSFKPQCTLWLFGNHKPKLSAAMDMATIKRIKLIKFGESIPKSEQDKQLTSKLKLELPGILNWAIAGFNDWRKNGFIEPESIKENVSEYVEENDTLGEFIDEAIELTDDENDKVNSQKLFETYRAWCALVNMPEGTKSMFTRRMKQRPEIKTSSSKSYCCMKFKSPYGDPRMPITEFQY